MKSITIALLLWSSCVSSALAGIFGPSNFEECVLEKMKGQAPNLMYMARAACVKAFHPSRSRLSFLMIESNTLGANLSTTQ